MTLIGRLLGWLIVAATFLGAAAVILMMLQIVADVALKNLISWPIPLTSILVANYWKSFSWTPAKNFCTESFMSFSKC